jgi:hypothetical protein
VTTFPAGWSGSPEFPNASNTGATTTAVTTLNVPAGGTSGTGWSWSGTTCTVTGNVSGLNVTGSISVTGANVTLSDCVAGPGYSGITIAASGVTVTACTAPSILFNTGGLSDILVEQCTVASSGGELIEMNVSSGAGVTGLTIQDCTLSGLDARVGRSAYGIDDNRGNTDPSLLIQRCNIYWCRLGISVTAGTIRDCYIHDFGYIQGDHTDGIANGGTGGEALNILHNTILMNRDETSPLPLGGSGSWLQNVTVDSNLLAGGDYCAYLGLEGGDNLRVDGPRTDSSGVTVSSGLTTVTDTHAQANDLNATITGTGIPANTTITNVTGSTYTINKTTTGSGTSVTVTPVVTVTSGSMTVADTHADSGDFGYVITSTPGTSMAFNTTITSVTQGVSYTISPAATGSATEVTIHYSSGIVVTNNRFSTVFFPDCGSFGTNTDFDAAVPSNVWAGNLIHETGVIAPL